ncbi:hypothetical protein [Flavobacterium sp. H4147]|uniref:hypothetical protein n=1 Tax=Flavobacterium sp. H4147 TaxID=3034149 RepID=UPI0023EB9331|nr:hypothetical protein [Flavobacterium sp. H4147]
MIKGLKDKSISNLKFSHYIVLFIIIYISDDTFNFGTNENYVYLLAKYIIYLLLTVYLLSVTNLKFLTTLTKSSLVFYLIVFFIILTSFYNFDISGGYVYQIWLFFLALLVVNFYSSKQFIYVYLKIVYTLSFVSLLIFIISNISSSIFQIFPMQTNSAGANVYNLGICMVSFENTYIRNMSIFREPGVFMIYLNFAVILELFFKEEINRRYLLVFILAIVSTFSTAAFIILGTILFAYLFIKSTKKVVLKNKAIILGLIMLAVLFILSSAEFYNMIFDKIGKDSIGEGSSLARGVSVLANFNIFLENFLFGVGIKIYPLTFSKATLALIGVSLDIGNNTNTITTILAVYGIFTGFLFVYMLFSFAKKTSNSLVIRVLIFLVLIMFYSNEDMRYSLMSAAMLMWGLKNKEIIVINNIAS